MIRWVSALTSVVLGIGSALLLAPDAQARTCFDPVCLHVDLHSPTILHRGETTPFTFTVSLTKPVTSTRFRAEVEKGLSVVPHTAAVDGAPVDGAQYSATSVRFAGSSLAAGTHTIAFAVQVANSVGAYADYDVELGYTSAAGNGGEGGQGDVPVAGDDYGISLEIPNGAPLLAQPDSWISFAGVVDGAGAQGGAILSVTLPRGLGTGVRAYVGDTERLGRRLDCKPDAKGVVSCGIPRNRDQDTPVEVFVPTTGHPPVGSTGVVRLHVEPVLENDPDPKDNDAQARVRFVPATHVSFAFSSQRITVAKGDTAKVALTVRNDGSTTTPRLTGQFDYTPSLDEANPPFDLRITGPGLFGGGGSQPFHVAPLHPGASAVYSISVQPHQVGTPLVLSAKDFTFSAAPGCFDAGCDSVGTVTFTPTTATGPPPLANTGATVATQLAGGLALLVLGWGFVAAGRRRRHG